MVHHKPQRLVSSSTVQNKNNPRKFYQHFVFKTIIVVSSVFIILVLPSDSPDVENPTIFDRGWELLQLIFVGIVVSYGLFSRKNDELEGKNDENNLVFDSGNQSYMSRLLNVTSVFHDEIEDLPSGFVHNDDNSDDHGEKIQTRNLEYVRNEPMIVVDEKSGKSCVSDKNCRIISGEKHLLLPVRSLNSRVICNENDGDLVGKESRDDFGVTRVFTRSNTSPVNTGFYNDSKGLGKNGVAGLGNGEESRVESRVSNEKDGVSVSRGGYGVARVSNRSDTSPANKDFSGNSIRLGGNDMSGMGKGVEFGVSSSIGYGRSNSSIDEKGFTSDSKGISGSESVSSRVGVASELGFVDGDRKVLRSLSKSKSHVGSRYISGVSRKSVSGDYKGLDNGGLEEQEEKAEESVVLTSPTVYARSNSSLSGKPFTGDSKGINRSGSVSSGVGIGNEIGSLDGDRKISRSLSRSSVSARDFSSISRKFLGGHYGGLDDGELQERKEKVEESVVLPSPIPWRSRSGRMLMQGKSYDSSTHSLPPSLEESEAARLLKQPQLSRSSSPSSNPSVSSPRKLSPSPTLSSESQAESVEGFGKRKSNYGIHLPPPPPPPAPTTDTSRLIKSSSDRNGRKIPSPHKDLKRSDESFNNANEESRVKSRNGADCTSVGRSVRTIRPGEMRSKRVELTETENPDTKTVDFFEKVLMETDEETESEGENYKEEQVETTKLDEPSSENVVDAETDIDKNVDKKADEFIAKFREQIRLQRIDSIKKSTGQIKRSFGR